MSARSTEHIKGNRCEELHKGVSNVDFCKTYAGKPTQIRSWRIWSSVLSYDLKLFIWSLQMTHLSFHLYRKCEVTMKPNRSWSVLMIASIDFMIEWLIMIHRTIENDQKWTIPFKKGENGHFWGSNVNKFNIFELISDNENQIIWRHY